MFYLEGLEHNSLSLSRLNEKITIEIIKDKVVFCVSNCVSLELERTKEYKENLFGFEFVRKTHHGEISNIHMATKEISFEVTENAENQ